MVDHGRGPRIPATGSRRRLQALIAEGFSYRILISELGIANPQWLHEFCKRDIRFTHIPFAQRVDEVYAKLQLAKPEDFGLIDFQIRRAKRTAVRHNWGNVMCWDDDTIDDPNAIPEWTGLCGSTKGWDIHMRENIPVCTPCQSAVNSFRGPQYAQAA